jgi:hypothetical protein
MRDFFNQRPARREPLRIDLRQRDLAGFVALYA